MTELDFISGKQREQERLLEKGGLRFLFVFFFLLLDSFGHYLTKVSFCGLTKGISPKICILCVSVKINKRSFEYFCIWIHYLKNKNTAEAKREGRKKKKKKEETERKQTKRNKYQKNKREKQFVWFLITSYSA